MPRDLVAPSASPTDQDIPRLTAPEYWALQRDRSIELKDHDPGARTIDLAARLAGFLAPGARILCVGCRNAHELDHLSRAGFPDALGIDLHSTDPRIAVMDMHAMSFRDGEFDAVFAAHVLEHALDPARAAREIRRVLRPRGVLLAEVPVQYGRRGADLWDFQTPERLAELFEPCQILWSEMGPQHGARQLAARLAVRVLPQAGAHAA